MKYLIIHFCLYAILFLPSNLIYGQEAAMPSFFDHLSQYESLKLIVVTNSKELMKKKDEYIKAEFTFSDGEVELFDLDGEIRTRGNIRKVVCSFPPTKLRFPPEFLKEHGFSSYKTLKLVNTCASSNASQTYVDAEHLIYKMYQLLTEKSFRVKKLDITYVSNQKSKKVYNFPAFLIEHEDQLADRVGGSVYNLKYFKEDMLKRKSYLTMCMFEYMVGNTDWYILNRHNVRVLRIPAEQGIFAVPYDFDYAGFINTTYAMPRENLPIKSVRERCYTGPCFTHHELDLVRKKFVDKKDDFFSLIQESTLIESKKKDCVNYIEQFYKELEHEKLSERIFVKCK